MPFTFPAVDSSKRRLLSASFECVTLSWGPSACSKPWRRSWGRVDGPDPALWGRKGGAAVPWSCFVQRVPACWGQPLLWASLFTSRLYLCSVWVTTTVPSPVTVARETQSCSGARILEKRGLLPQERLVSSERLCRVPLAKGSVRAHLGAHCIASVCYPNLWCFTPKLKGVDFVTIHCFLNGPY